MIAQTAPKRRGRPRKTLSFADWMAKIDAEVDAAARQMERQPPTFADLHPAQRRLVHILIEHLRSLPELQPGENPFWRTDGYWPVNVLLTDRYAARYPNWKTRHSDGQVKKPFMVGKPDDLATIPADEAKEFEWLLRNAGGRAPAKRIRADEDEDDD